LQWFRQKFIGNGKNFIASWGKVSRFRVGICARSGYF